MWSSDLLTSNTPSTGRGPSSDGSVQLSSPPSSPPGFPWDEPSTNGLPSPKKDAKSAFSLLGKRKAFINGSVSDDGRPPKRRASMPLETKRKPECKPALTQTRMSLGQAMQKNCKTCGMEYVPSSEEDRKLHDQYHSQSTLGFEVGKDFLSKANRGTVLQFGQPGEGIVTISKHDVSSRKRKARAALNIAQRELGAVDIPDNELWSDRYTSHLYVRDKRCIGFLLTETISKAHKVLEPEQEVSGTLVGRRAGAKSSALSALKARREASENATASGQSIRLSEDLHPAVVGISRVWVSPKFRHQAIATSLLDAAVGHAATLDPHNTHNVLQTDNAGEACAGANSSRGTQRAIGAETRWRMENVAFSQPTDAGRRLAMRWFGRSWGWMVYIP